LVAIKVLKDENLEDEDFCRRFHAESRAVAMLSHANIVSVYDVSNDANQDYIVMELIDGITLKQYMERRGRLNWRETLHFATHIAKALEHAHSRGLVHRDIKPHNVMVLKNGAVKVADFGIARLMESDNTMTKEALGSVHYISPEQAKGSNVDSRSDLYSLGVVMYEMITGRTPYDGDSPVAVAIQHINGGARRPSAYVPNIPKGLEQIIMKAMAHDIQDRYINATAMLRDLEEFHNNPDITFLEMPVTEDMERRGELRLHQSSGQLDDMPDVPELPQRREVRWQMPGTPEPVEDGMDEEDSSNKGRIATIAVIICSVVAVLAIVIFMILLTENDTSGLNTIPKDTQLHLQQEKPMQTQVASSTQSVTTLGAVSQPAVVTQATAQPSYVPQTQFVKMQNLVNLTREEAEVALTLQGFTDVQWKEEASSLPAGTVLAQSVSPDAWVDVEATLVVVCAAGSVTIPCSFELPFRMEQFYLTILLDGRPVVVEQPMDPLCTSVSFQLTGKGKQLCQLFINGEPYQTVTVDFDAYAGK
jgi:serine/threonine protein kinase